VWLFLIVLFAVAESTLLLFHHARGRQSLSVSEAVLLPMFVSFSLDQVVWGVFFAMVLVRARVFREGMLRHVFNVSQYVLAAALGAVVWSVLRDASPGLDGQDVIAAVVALIAYAASSHVFVACAITFAEGARFVDLVRAVGPATLLNLGGSIAIGVLFAASYSGAHWTLLLFPLPLAGLYLGFRAMVRQSGERERVEKLHEATRALASSPDLDQAVAGFLGAVAQLASAADAGVLIASKDRFYWTRVGSSRPEIVMEETTDGPLLDLLNQVQSTRRVLVASGDADTPGRTLAERLGAHSMIVAPFVDEDGFLAVFNRTGADEFGEADARLIEALAQELVLSLDSYRLFAEVAEERQRFRRIFDASKEGVCLLDADARVRAWNPTLERMSGYSETEVMGAPWSDRIVIRTRDHRRIEGLDLVEVRPETELELVSREGPSRWVSILSSATQAAKEAGWVVLVRDVTAEHEAEEAKSDFLSTISHELRTPLTSIKGSLTIMSRGADALPPGVFDQMVGVMSRASDRLERLVLNLLFVSQMETDRAPELLGQEVVLDPVVRDKVEAILRDHSAIELRLADPPLVVRADRERVGQVIEHLLENALKFGGSGRITVEVRHSNGYAELVVGDQGPGIPAIDHERIFDRFVRLGNVLTRETQGAGVGLFIVKRAVDAMDGEVWVESQPGQGARFHVKLPLARPALVTDSASA